MHVNKNDDFFSIIHSCHIDLIISSYGDWNVSKWNIQFFRKNALYDELYMLYYNEPFSTKVCK